MIAALNRTPSRLHNRMRSMDGDRQYDREDCQLTRLVVILGSPTVIPSPGGPALPEIRRATGQSRQRWPPIGRRKWLSVQSATFTPWRSANVSANLKWMPMSTRASTTSSPTSENRE